jgi:hypothetical protein
LQRLFAPVGMLADRFGDVSLDFPARFVDRFGKQSDIFLRTLNVVEGRFGCVANVNPPFRPADFTGTAILAYRLHTRALEPARLRKL